MDLLTSEGLDSAASSSGASASVLDYVVSLNSMTTEQLFTLDPKDVEAFQLEAVRARFAEMRPRIKLLDRLATDVGVDRIDAIEDVTAVCFPHTMYKSYSVNDVEKGRFDKLNRWLSTLTAHDLSQVDVSGCETLEGWMTAVEAATPLRPVCSSGTSGKISFFPLTDKILRYRVNNYTIAHGRFHDEQGSGLETGKVDFFCPWPVATGRHNLPRFFRALRDYVFGGEPGHVFTLGHGHWDLDMLWISGRLRAAEAQGETAGLKLTPAHEAARQRVLHEQAQAKANIDGFIEELIVKRRGQRVFFFAPFLQMIPLAEEIKARGLKAEWAADSYVLAGGRSGSKGVAFPEGWYELCKEIVPFDYQEVYGMTESTGSARRCSHGHFHMPPWIVPFLLDPDTSEPLERKGRQTGRYCLFDLLPDSYWGGAITGDRITIDFDGGCGCGRKGPYIGPEITRYSNLRDDDKITCAKSPGAYDNVVKLALGEIA